MSFSIPLRLRALIRHPRVRPFVVTAFWSLVTFYFVFAALILTTRWYLLPQVDRYKGDIADFLSSATRSEVSIGHIEPRWDGFWPQLRLADVRFVKPHATAAHDEMLVLPSLKATFNWKSALGTVSFRSLIIEDASLSIRRTGSATYDIGGFVVDLSDRPNNADAGSTIAAVLEQDNIHITNATLRYIDLTTETPKELHFNALDLSFIHDFSGWNLGLQASQIHERGTYPIDIRAHFEKSLFGTPDDWTAWSGLLYGRFEQVDFADIIGNVAPITQLKTAQGGGEFWLDIKAGRPIALRSTVNFDTFSLQFSDDLAPIGVTRLTADVTQTFDGRQLTLDINNLAYTAHDRVPVPPVDIHAALTLNAAATDTDSAKIQISRIDLATLSRSLQALPLPENVKMTMRSLKPTGRLDDVSIGWFGSWRSPSDFSLESRFEALTVASRPHTKENGDPTVGIPGIVNMTGRLQADAKGGSVLFDSRQCSLVLPGIFPDPVMPLNALRGKLYWMTPEDAPLEVGVQELLIDHASARAVADGNWRNTGKAGTLDLKADIIEGKTDEAWHFLPTILHAGTRQWLEGGLRGGHVRNGKAVIRGQLNQFPWTDPGTDGRFYVDAELDDAVLDYVPSYRKDANGAYIGGEHWPLLTHIKGKLIFEGLSMLVLADSAKTNGVDLRDVRAEIPQLNAKDVMLNIDGTIREQPLDTMIDYLDASPVGPILGDAFAKTSATGLAGLDLRLEIPLLHAKDTRVKGRVHLMDNDVSMGWPVPPLTDVTGYVDFSHRGTSSDALRAKAFGHPVTAKLSTDQHGTIAIDVKGKASAQDVLFFNREPLVRAALAPLSGITDFDVSVAIEKNKGTTVNVTSDLLGIESAYPVPMNKTADTRWPTRFTFKPITRGSRSGHLLSLSLSDRFSMLMQLGSGGSSSLSTRGTFSLGTSPSLPSSGFALELVGKEVRLDDWIDPIASFVEAGKQTSRSSDATPEELSGLQRIAVDIDRLYVDDMLFTNVHANSRQRSPNVWRTIVNSDSAEGTVVWDMNAPGLGSLQGKLARLHLPIAKVDRIKSILAQSEEAQMPSINATVDDFSINAMQFGKVTLDAANTHDKTGPVWTIRSLTMDNPAAQLTADGVWRYRDGKNTTHIEAHLLLHDAGALCDRMGFRNVIHRGNGTVDLDLRWEGKPWIPDPESINGAVGADLKKGTLVQVDKGAGGTLLSLVSMQSLIKRLSLDFSDLVQKGVSFDRLTGNNTFVNGIASTVDTQMTGQHGTVLIDGSADLTNETIDYRILVLPDVNAGGASLALAIVNPAVGLGSFVAQMVLKEPLSRLFSVQYDIKGPIADPVIEKKTHQTKSVEELDRWQ